MKQYETMTCNVVRPPSRHKDPPQNQGLDLPEDDGQHYFAEDHDSEDEFEIGIIQAPGIKKILEKPNPFNPKQHPLFRRSDNSDGDDFDNEVESVDSPKNNQQHKEMKDFLNNTN